MVISDVHLSVGIWETFVLSIFKNRVCRVAHRNFKIFTGLNSFNCVGIGDFIGCHQANTIRSDNYVLSKESYSLIRVFGMQKIPWMFESNGDHLRRVYRVLLEDVIGMTKNVTGSTVNVFVSKNTCSR